MAARTLMVQGTSSSVGKSLLTAALCRIFLQRGLRVVPFKAQNMSNQAAVCRDGSEIGRAQYVQAMACGLEPTVDMSPILLKPEANGRSQVVVMGKAWASLPAGGYYSHKVELWHVVTSALDRLRRQYDMVIMEGAGSPAELNLRAGDIVNMAVAAYCASPVLLVGDIDRGGVFAQLLGTLWLLPEDERALVKGLVVNKFRGDLALFADGVHILEEKSGVPVLGVIPYIQDVGISEEDAVALDTPRTTPQTGQIDIAVIQLPHISNFDDFDPLAAETGVAVRYVRAARELGEPDAIILPGSKSTVSDLNWLRATGLAGATKQHAARAKPVVGICGGYQMLGQSIRDPHHIESPEEETMGLGLLPVTCVFAAEKATHQVRGLVSGGSGWMAACRGAQMHGYEIHMGRSKGQSPWLTLTERSRHPVSIPDGSASADGLIWGCYVHGLFENTPVRRAWLSSLGWQASDATDDTGRLMANLDRLARVVEQSLDMARLEKVWES